MWQSRIILNLMSGERSDTVNHMNAYNLTELAQSETKMERVIAAGHIDIPIESLKKLVTDPEWEVREVASRNLQRLVAELVSPETLKWLSSAEIPNDILNWLKLHPDTRVALTVSPKAPDIDNWNE